MMHPGTTCGPRSRHRIPRTPIGRTRRLASALLLAVAACGATLGIGNVAVAQDTAPGANARINGALDAFFTEGGTPRKAVAMAATIDPAIYEFAHDPTVSDEVHRTFVDTLTTDGTPEQREALRQFLEQFTIEQQRALMRDGFESGDWSATNVADVVAGSVLTGYGIIGETETVAAQDEPVRDLFRTALDVPEVTDLSDRDKQVMSETLLLASVGLVVRYQQVEEDDGDLVPVQDAARQLLQEFGLDPALFRLGPDGLEMTPEMAKVASGEMTMEQAFPDVVTEITALGATAVGSASTGANAPTDPASTADPAANPLGAGDAVAAPNPPVAPASVFVGTFAGEEVTLSLQGASTGLTGEIVQGGQRYPATAMESADGLIGRFVANGATFDFTARLDGAIVTLETGGREYRLEPKDVR